MSDRVSRIDLAPLPLVVREARRHARVQLQDVLDEDRLQDALLIVSELVTNAVLHGFPPGQLSLEVGADQIRVAVEDSSEALPVLRAHDDDAHRGRGIALVDALADRWGVDTNSAGQKQVWFELRIGGSAPA